MNVEKLEFHAKNIRRNIIKMIHNSQSGHPGGSLSIVEILTYLYFERMNIKPENPLWKTNVVDLMSENIKEKYQRYT